jgi:prepilin-type N-terminal cleavage/methylation domain-containing protein
VINGRRRDSLCPDARGFTLIELLVTIAIVAILVGAVVINIEFRNVGKQMSDSARRTGLVMNLASDQAVYSRTQLGIRFHPGSYEFWALLAEEEGDEPAWTPVDDPRLTFRPPDVNVLFELDLSGQPVILEELEEELSKASTEDPLEPHVWFLSNGELLPDFRVIMRDEEDEYRWQIASGEVKPIVVEQLDSP